MNFMLVFIGGGLGSLARYSVNILFKSFTDFPFATLTVNIFGSFLMGIIITLIANKFFTDSEQLRLFLAVGFLGGFTTFSSFSIESLTLVTKNDLLCFFINIFANVIFGLTAAFFGIVLAKYFLK